MKTNKKVPSPFVSFSILDFRLFLAARFFLVIAVQMQMTTIGLQVYYQFSNRNEYFLGLIGLFEAIPFILFSFYSGYCVDQFNRKKIILIAVSVLLLGSLFLTLFANGYFIQLIQFGCFPLFAVVALFGIVRSFLAAATTAFMTQIIPRDFYANGATWNSALWHISSIVGPVIAAFIYSASANHTAELAYLLNSGLFMLAFFIFLLIKKKPMPTEKKDEGIFNSLTAGLKFVFKSKIILGALSLDLFAVLFGGAIVILPAFNDKILHSGPSAFGLLRASPAIGAVIMAAFLSYKPPAKNAGKLLLISVLMFGLFTIAFSFCTNYWLAFLFLCLIGAVDNVSVVIRHTVLQLMTPENMRGRVGAVNGIFIGSSNEIGGYESGLCAKIIGLVPSIIFGGCMVIGVVLGVNASVKDLKKLDLSKI